MEIERIQNDAPRVPELIMQALITAMDEGRFKVGDELPPERELADMLGVGRGSLRECLAVLQYMNIIETRGNRKIVARDASYFRRAVAFFRLSNQPDTLVDCIQFRLVMETAIVELACDHATEEDFDRINDTIIRLERDLYDYMADVEFHSCLARASHNTMFAVTMDLIASMIADVRIRYFQLPNYFQRTLDSHRAIYQAVRARDKERAKKEMATHLALIGDFMRETAEDGERGEDSKAPV